MTGGATSGERAQRGGLLGAVVRLGRALRDRGVVSTPAETIDAARALGEVDVADRDDVFCSLRAIMISRPEDFAAFDEAFAEVWRPTEGVAAPLPAPNVSRAKVPPPVAKRETRPVSLQNWMKPEGEPSEGAPVQLRAASDRESLEGRDFAGWRSEETDAFERIARQIARRLSMRRSRRWKVSRRGARIDLRRSARSALRTSGELMRLVRRERRIRRTRLVALCDVSGSMELYARFLLQFLHALQNSFASVETFVFATRLSRITEHLRGARYQDALRELGRDVRDWSGGTRIGASLRSFVERFPCELDRRTIVVILSDGWDVGDPAELERAMAEVRRRAGRVIWLNPLMGAPGFSPETRGMQAALPHVDILAPGHSLEALRALVRELVI